MHSFLLNKGAVCDSAHAVDAVTRLSLLVAYLQLQSKPYVPQSAQDIDRQTGSCLCAGVINIKTTCLFVHALVGL